MNECAIAARVFIEHGATIIPSVGNEPLLMDAARSWLSWTTVASAWTFSTVHRALVSNGMVSFAPSLTTRWVSTPASFNASRVRIP